MIGLPFKILLSPYLLPLTLFAGGFLWFWTASTPACPTLATDAKIFVLTGDARRIPFALDKLSEHPGRQLYIIGVGGPTLDVRYQHKTEIENESRSTYENAVAIRHIVRRDNLRSIVIITTEDHMNRSLFFIRGQLPQTELIPCPVPLSNMVASRQLERWIEEYIKFIGALVGLTSRKN